MIEAFHLFFESDFDFQCLNSLWKFIERDPIVKVHVEKAESMRKIIKSFVNSEPNQLKISFDSRLVWAGSIFDSRCRILPIRRHNHVDVGTWIALRYFLLLFRHKSVQIYQITKGAQIDFAIYYDFSHDLVHKWR